MAKLYGVKTPAVPAPTRETFVPPPILEVAEARLQLVRRRLSEAADLSGPAPILPADAAALWFLVDEAVKDITDARTKGTA